MGFLRADYVNVVFIVLPQFEFVPFVEEIVEFPAVYFVEGKPGFQVPEVGLDMFFRTLAKYSKMSFAPR